MAKTLDQLTNGLEKLDGVLAVRRKNNSYALDAEGKIIALSLSGSALESLALDEKAAALEYLYLVENEKLKEIAFSAPLPRLAVLYLNKCALTSLKMPAGCIALEYLYLQKNQLAEVAFEGRYPALRLLDASDNQLTEFVLPAGAARLEYLYLNGNDGLTSPPIDIVKQGSQAALNWFAAEKKALQEIKVLLVGEAKAGKTSILRRLKHNEYSPDEVQTDGIVIETFDFEKLPTFSAQTELHGITAYFWDFGGQEIMNSTHQFFMTKRSVYLLILEARKDAEPDQQVRKWMKRIQAFGSNSPVIVATNKIELNRAFGLNEHNLRKEFPQIRDFIRLSCAENENIDGLRRSLETFIPQAELFDTQIDERWIAIKEELQEITKENHYLNHSGFLAICEKHGLGDAEEQKQAITFLNDLGILLHFDELNLAEYYVLDPYWVTSGVYRIVTSELAGEKKGKVRLDQLNYIVNQEPRKVREYRSEEQKPHQYSPNELLFLADIMAQFKLSYYTDERKTILIPDLLDPQTPAEESEHFLNAPERLRLAYKYDYLPSSVLPRFMVEMQKDIEKPWRTGAILSGRGNTPGEAMVTASENKVDIIVTGDYKQKREYLSVIRFFLDKVNSEINLNPEIYIPLPGYEKHFVKYDTLLKMEKAGETTYKNWDIGKEFSIRVLLDGIQSKEEILKDIQIIIGPDPQRRKAKKKVLVICSSPTDKNPLDFGKELDKIIKAWESSNRRDEFERPIIEPAVAAEDFCSKVLKHKPAILHLTMHASKMNGLYFEGKNGKEQPVSPERLLEYFGAISGEYRPEVCILSACNTLEHARAIQPYVHFVVGTRDFIPDRAAVIYAEGFYKAFFDGNKLETAHRLGQLAIKDWEKAGGRFSSPGLDIPTHEIPVLLPE